eukprot:Em0002g650a
MGTQATHITSEGPSRPGVITKGASSNIVTYIAHHIWTHTKYPTSEEYTEVCRELVTKYPVLKDTTGTAYEGTPGENGEPAMKKMRGSPDQSTTVVHEAAHASRGDEFGPLHRSTHGPPGDGFGPLHIEEMSSFYNDSSISSYQDGWPDVKIKMPALEET